MMKMGQFTGEGLALGISNMVGMVENASSKLAEGITAPVSYTAERTPVQEVQDIFTDVPTVSGNVPINAAGSTNPKTDALKKEIKLVIEKIVLNDTGEKDKKQLVKELLEELIEELKGADEIFSDADLGVLL